MCGRSGPEKIRKQALEIIELKAEVERLQRILDNIMIAHEQFRRNKDLCWHKIHNIASDYQSKESKEE